MSRWGFSSANTPKLRWRTFTASRKTSTGSSRRIQNPIWKRAYDAVIAKHRTTVGRETKTLLIHIYCWRWCRSEKLHRPEALEIPSFLSLCHPRHQHEMSFPFEIKFKWARLPLKTRNYFRSINFYCRPSSSNFRQPASRLACADYALRGESSFMAESGEARVDRF